QRVDWILEVMRHLAAEDEVVASLDVRRLDWPGHDPHPVADAGVVLATLVDHAFDGSRADEVVRGRLQRGDLESLECKGDGRNAIATSDVQHGAWRWAELAGERRRVAKLLAFTVGL